MFRHAVDDVGTVDFFFLIGRKDVLSGLLGQL
jgi:hypothetical protein